MYFLAGPLTPVLDALATWTGNYGLGIIILTLVIRGLLFPLQAKSMKSAAQMRELQPKMNELKEKYKDNPEEYQKRMMALYKEHNMNPMGGCLPMLIQLPVMFGLYRVLLNFPERLAENPDLQAAIATSFLGIDMLTPSIVMAILAGVTSLAMTFTMPGDPSQRKIMAPMSLFTAWIGFVLPAGVALYITVTNILSSLQQLLMRPKTAVTPKS